MKMKAMVLSKPKHPLRLTELPCPNPNDLQVLLQVLACGICRTDLHILDGELTKPKLPLIPGHQIVGIIKAMGKDVHNLKIGQRIGIPWLGESCQHCHYCLNHQENLCDDAKFTGYQINGGFAEYCIANSQFCFPIPETYSNEQAAPLLCAGLIGYRAYRKIKQAKRLGIYGFGAAAHILVQIARYHQQQIYAFTKKEDKTAQAFAMSLGAVWAGDAMSHIVEPLDAAIIFAPEGALVPQALRQLRKGGTIVCAGIHMSDIPSFPYEILWGERTITSVANLTREDGEEFLSLASLVPIHTKVNCYPLTEANEALNDLRQGNFSGAGVLIP